MRRKIIISSITAIISAVLAVIAGLVLPSAALAAAPATLFGSTSPALASDVDSATVELGVQFRTSVDGQVSGVRFYKGSGNTGPHVGYLYSGSTRIASTAFNAESASGWQKASFASPINVKAGQIYTVSYLAPKGAYAVNSPYAFPKSSGSLTALKGVYKYGGGYPTNTYQSSNYWVDLTFTATNAPPTSTASPTAASSTPIKTSGSTSPTVSTPVYTTTVATPPTSTVAPTTAASTTTASTTTIPTTSWPSAANTGVPAGVALTDSGSLTINTAGTVIDALNITGTVQINANNVTLRRSRVTGSDYAIIRVKDGATGVRIEDVEINGLGTTSGTSNSGGVIGPATVVRSNLYGLENGLVPGSGSVIQDSWIHDLGAPGAPHYDGVQMDGGLSNISIQHNTVDLTGLGQTSAVMVDNYFGSISAISVNNNRLLGAGYTVYCDGQFASPTINGINFTNNRIAGGQWGPFLIRNCNSALAGNVNDSTSAPITG